MFGSLTLQLQLSVQHYATHDMRAATGGEETQLLARVSQISTVS